MINILKNFKLELTQKIKFLIKRKLSSRGMARYIQINNFFYLFKFKKSVGKNSYIDKTVHVTGWGSILIGENSIISENTWLNVNIRTLNHKHIVIGNNCYIGRRNFFSSGWQIYMSDYIMTGIDCKFMGSDHIFNTPFEPYIATGTTNDKIIKICTNVWLGAGVVVIGNVTIGHGSIIGAGALVNKDIPPFSIAVGNPCKVIKRFDFNKNEWVSVKNYNEDIQNIISEEEYKTNLKSNYPKINMPLQAASRQFGDMF